MEGPSPAMESPFGFHRLFGASVISRHMIHSPGERLSTNHPWCIQCVYVLSCVFFVVG